MIVGTRAFFMKSQVWERWIWITLGTWTAFPCAQWHFDHWINRRVRWSWLGAYNYVAGAGDAVVRRRRRSLLHRSTAIRRFQRQQLETRGRCLRSGMYVVVTHHRPQTYLYISQAYKNNSGLDAISPRQVLPRSEWLYKFHRRQTNEQTNEWNRRTARTSPSRKSPTFARWGFNNLIQSY